MMNACRGPGKNPGLDSYLLFEGVIEIIDHAL